METSAMQAFLSRFIHRPLSFYLFSLFFLVLLYGRTLSFGYVGDDILLLVRNPAIINKDFQWEIFTRAVLDGTSYFRPLVFISWWGEAQLLGNLFASFSHLINVLLFYVLVILVFNIVRVLTAEFKYSVLISTVCALVYLIHPANVEVVAWVSGRFDLMASLFVYAALLVFLTVRTRALQIPLVLLFNALALLSKETGVLLLPFILLLDLFRHHNAGSGWWRQLVQSCQRNKALLYGLLLVLGLYLLVRLSYGSGLYHQRLDADYIRLYYLQYQAPVLALKEYILYALFPFANYTMVTPIEFIADNANTVRLSWLVVALTALALFYLFYKRNRNALLILGFLAGIGLVLHLVPMTILDNLRADRFLGIALLFAALLLAQFINYFATNCSQKLTEYFSLGLFIYIMMTAVVASSAVVYWQNDDVMNENINRHYQRYSHGQVNKGYFTSLLNRPGNRELVRDIIARERQLAEQQGRYFEFDLPMAYGLYLVHHYRDPEGLKIIEEYIPHFETPGQIYKNDTLRINGLTRLYRFGAEGELYINHDVAKAREYQNKIRHVDSRMVESMEFLQQDILINTLLDDREALREDLQRLAPYHKVQHSDQSVHQILSNYINFHVKKLCGEMADAARRPACAPDFDMERLLNELGYGN